MALQKNAFDATRGDGGERGLWGMVNRLKRSIADTMKVARHSKWLRAAAAGRFSAGSIRKVVEREFDVDYYAAANRDIAEAQTDPVGHFLRSGWREGRRPVSYFDPAYYLESNPDVAAAGINPYFHYIVHGREEGRLPASPYAPAQSTTAPTASSDASPARPRSEAVSSEVREVVARGFDPNYYVQAYPDVASEMDPLDHFLEVGWREGRKPALDFDTEYYLRANPDVAAAGINPYYHYLVAGHLEGRQARQRGGAARGIIAEARPPSERARDWVSVARRDSLSAAELNRRFVEAGMFARDGITVSLSHDQYTRIAGGIQSCVGDEQRALDERGWAYLHLSPAQPLPMLSPDTSPDSFFFSVTLDGKPIGEASADALMTALDPEQRSQEMPTVAVVHHLLGHSPEIVTALLHRLGVRRTFVWVHDFFTLCPNYALLRNDVEFCWAPPPSSGACRICVYGAERGRHLERVTRLFHDLNPVAVTPSDAARELWVARSPLRYRDIVVRPHAAVEFDGVRPRRTADPGRPLRVAFIGATVSHKGWHVFAELVTQRARDPRYTFLHFGSAPPPLAGFRHVSVTVTPDRRQAMVDALRAEEVDVVVAWSLCYETFSFMAHEAIAAGSFVISRKDSGNLSRVVAESGHGAVLDSDAELFALFDTGEIIRLCEPETSTQVRTGFLRPGTVTAALIAGS